MSLALSGPIPFTYSMEVFSSRTVNLQVRISLKLSINKNLLNFLRGFFIRIKVVSDRIMVQEELQFLFLWPYRVLSLKYTC
jgi:hypothetical protein